MSSPLHSEQTTDDGIHTIVAWYYPNNADRLADTGFVPSDIGKVCYCIEEASLWLLNGYAPISWLQVATGATEVAWGDITSGVIDDQTDLALALAGKAPLSHTHSISEVVNLQTALDAKFDNPTGATTQYLDGEGTPVDFPDIPDPLPVGTDLQTIWNNNGVWEVTSGILASGDVGQLSVNSIVARTYFLNTGSNWIHTLPIDNHSVVCFSSSASSHFECNDIDSKVNGALLFIYRAHNESYGIRFADPFGQFIYPPGIDGSTPLRSATLVYSSTLSGWVIMNYTLMSAPTTPVNADWNAATGLAQILNKPDLATVATTGSYNDLSDTPTMPVVSNADYNATSWNGDLNAPSKNAVRDQFEADRIQLTAGDGISISGIHPNKTITQSYVTGDDGTLLYYKDSIGKYATSTRWKIRDLGANNSRQLSINRSGSSALLAMAATDTASGGSAAVLMDLTVSHSDSSGCYPILVNRAVTSSTPALYIDESTYGTTNFSISVNGQVRFSALSAPSGGYRVLRADETGKLSLGTATGSEAGGSSSFLGLDDTYPTTYAGHNGKFVVVDSTNNRLDFATVNTLPSGGSYTQMLVWSPTGSSWTASNLIHLADLEPGTPDSDMRMLIGSSLAELLTSPLAPTHPVTVYAHGFCAVGSITTESTVTGIDGEFSNQLKVGTGAWSGAALEILVGVGTDIAFRTNGVSKFNGAVVLDDLDANSIIYLNGSKTIGSLPFGTNGQYLKSTGTGVAWDTPGGSSAETVYALGNLTGSSQTFNFANGGLQTCALTNNQATFAITTSGTTSGKAHTIYMKNDSGTTACTLSFPTGHRASASTLVVPAGKGVTLVVVSDGTDHYWSFGTFWVTI